jgi:hypothetical protein
MHNDIFTWQNEKSPQRFTAASDAASPAAIRIGLRMRKIKWRLPKHWQDDAIEKQF